MSSGPTGSDDARFVSLSDEDAVKEILRTTVLNLWRAVNTLTRLRPSKHERYRVTIFGSARAKPGTFVYDEVKRVAAALAGMGCDIVTGGGPGLMQAANEGARGGWRDRARSASASNCRSSRTSTRSSSRRSSTRPSSRGCTTSCSPRTPSSSRPAASARCSR